MIWLGGVLDEGKSREWLDSRVAHWREHGYGRFHVEGPDGFVGFVGLSRTEFDAGFVPDIEIAWRLAYEHWGKGYATEAARAVLDDGFNRVRLSRIVGVTTIDNLRSRRVMERLGMAPAPEETFVHPVGSQPHVVYRLSRPKPLRVQCYG